MKNPVPRLIELTLCLAIGAGLSVIMGQDASWDLRNYHLYNPFSVLHGRLDWDFFPADKQTGNNPLPDFLYAGLALGPLSHFPRALAAVMGLWYGLLIFVVIRLAAHLFAPFPKTERRILMAAGILVASTGAITLSQIGSTSNDILIGALVLAGFLFSLHAESAGHPKRLWVVSGLFFGLAAGAKLTGCIYGPAMLLTLFAILPPRQALRAGAIFAAGWLAAFLASFGWWGFMLWERFGNPTFPMFNAIFKSPLAPHLNLRDVRFLPHDALQWAAYPFYWAFDARLHPVYETDFRDPRMAIALLALIVLGIVAARDFFCRSQGQGREPALLISPQKMAVAFLIFSYVGWLLTSSILRYAVAIEALSALVALMVTVQLAMRAQTVLPKFAPLGTAVFICALCLVATRVPDWPRRDFEDKVFNVDMTWVRPDTLFISVYEPTAYLAAFVPEDAHARFAGLPFIKYLEGTPLGETGLDLVRSHRGPITVLFRYDRRPFLQQLSLVGLSPDVKNCRTIQSNLAPKDAEPLLACEAVRL